MTRYIRQPSPRDDRPDVDWHAIVAVRYVIEGQRRVLRLDYPNGEYTDWPVADGLILWEQVRDTADCDFPCYFRRQCDNPPDTCRDCQLLAHVIGAGHDPRPPVVRVPVRSGEDWRNWALGVLVCLVLLLVTALASVVSGRQQTSGRGIEKGEKR